jgi:MFS family permease
VTEQRFGVPTPHLLVPALGVAQILAWGSSYYLLAVLAVPISRETGWPLPWVVGGISLGLLTAGLVSPRVGDSIQRYGGRPVLAFSALFLAVGLTGLALASSILVYAIAWVVIGVGMGAGLYDASFATLGRLFGQRARTAIATLTLFGGFASTVCWPLSAFLVSEFGWRGTCLTYAGVHVFILIPLYLIGVPREPKREEYSDRPRSDRRGAGVELRQIAAPFALMAAAVTVSAMISTAFSVHLLTILQSRGMTLSAAVVLGALVGPSQVGARVTEMLVGRYHQPIWTLVGSTVLVAIGVGSLWMGLPLVATALVLYGGGIGIESIARGTLPLVLFGEKDYATIMGRIAMPSLVGQAASPSLGALLMRHFGSGGTLGVLFMISLVDLLLAIALLAFVQKRRA